MQQIRVLVASGLFCTEFNFARGIKIICIEMKKWRTSLQKTSTTQKKKETDRVYVIGTVFVRT